EPFGSGRVTANCQRSRSEARPSFCGTDSCGCSPIQVGGRHELMAYACLWLCLSCGSQTTNPKIVRGRAGGWRCRQCRRKNFHSKNGNWISQAPEKKRARRFGVEP